MPQPGLSLKSRFSLDLSLWTQLQGLIISRMLRAAAIQRGRSGPTQRFSKSKEADPVLEHLLLETLNPDIHSARRVQLLFDRTRVSQFACLFGQGVGFFTCPTITSSDLEDPMVAGSLSDQIGHAIPVTVSLSDFLSYFTSLAKQGDVDAFSLLVHPTKPDLIGPNPQAGVRPYPG